MDISIPRDRKSEFEPQIIPKGQRRFTGFDDRILSMYARGMTVRDIQGHLKDLYNVEVSPDLISTVTDGVVEQVREWQNRPSGPALHDHVFRRFADEDSRRGPGGQQGGLSGSGRQP